MGMFDYVTYTAPCWKCGVILDTWQSKDGECFMQTLVPEDVRQFYELCGACGAWNEYKVVPVGGVRIEANDERPTLSVQAAKDA